MLLLGDGIFDRMENKEIMKMIWNSKIKGKIIDNIHKYSGNIVDMVMKKSMAKLSTDNVSAIFIGFKNFENKMKNAEFEYGEDPECKYIENEIDYDSKDN